MNQHRFYPSEQPPAISLRPQQAAHAIGISLSTLERLTKTGEVPAVKVGRVRLYSVDALKDWLHGKGGTNAAH
jgi:excisionase family DNA binding protein